MNLQIAQISRVAYYEFRMHWRERSLLVVMLAIGVMNVISILLMASNAIPLGIDMHRAIAALLAAPISVALSILLPIIVSGTIPKDEQWGVRELFDTLPMSPGVYLAGKVLGLWAGVLVGLLVLAVVVGVLYRAIVGSFDLLLYIEMWLLVGVSLVVLNGTLGVLVPAGQPNRRRAVVLMVVVFTLPFLLLQGSFDTSSLLAYVNPIRFAIVMHYSTALNNSMTIPVDATRDLIATLVAGVAELVLVAALVWGWMRWKGEHV